MTDDTSITVADRTFEDREALADYVGTFLDNRIYDPMEVACIQKLAALANGGAPDGVHRIARQTAFHAPDRGDADERRQDTPFGERIEELGEEAEEAESAHGEAVERLHDLRAKLQRARATGEPTGGLMDQVRAASEDEQDARRAAVRAKAALNAARKAADRWILDHEARFVVGDADDRQVVDREGLLAWLDR